MGTGGMAVSGLGANAGLNKLLMGILEANSTTDEDGNEVYADEAIATFVEDARREGVLAPEDASAPDEE